MDCRAFASTSRVWHLASFERQKKASTACNPCCWHRPKRLQEPRECCHPGFCNAVNNGRPVLEPLQGSRGVSLPEFFSHRTVGIDAPILCYLTLILVRCLHPTPPRPSTHVCGPFLLHIKHLWRGWWSCFPCLRKQILKPGPAFRSWPETIFPGFAPLSCLYSLLINTVPPSKKN